jgi:3',5'-nucleoside bisphosphate phosphatase
MLIDLQLHSKYSDGYLSPSQLARKLASYNVKVASLTDHNSIAGQEEFALACKKYDIKSINGLELYVRHGNYTFNVLWYNYDLNSFELLDLIEPTWVRRRKKVKKIVDSLIERGFKIDLDNFIKKHQNYLPINHLVDHIFSYPKNRRIIKKDLEINNPRENEVISHYFYPKTGLRLKEARVSFERIIEKRKKIGGQIIFAHPALNRRLKKNLILNLKKAGLDGLEVLSPHHSYNSIVYLSSLVKEFDLISTGGSDIHLAAEPGTKPQYAWDYFKIDSRNLSQIDKIIN